MLHREAAVFQPRKFDEHRVKACRSSRVPTLHQPRSFQPRKHLRSCYARRSLHDHWASMAAAVFQPRKLVDVLGQLGPLPTVASMGPRSFNRGNKKPTRWLRKFLLLEWGCSLSTAETHVPARNWTVLTSILGFNGAAVFQPRKRADRASTFRSTTPLQWGRGLSTAETWKPCRSFHHRRRAPAAAEVSNGAAVFSTAEMTVYPQDRSHDSADGTGLPMGAAVFSTAEISRAAAILRAATR